MKHLSKFVAFLTVFAVVVGPSCTDEESTRETLLGQGYDQIETLGYAFTGCSDEDDTCTGFKAVGPTGYTVRGVVGCGRHGCSKACTVRIKHSTPPPELR